MVVVVVCVREGVLHVEENGCVYRGVIVGDEGCVLLINAPTLHSFGSKSHRQVQETHTLGCSFLLLKGLHTWG